jgi:hypothetical protein
MKMCGDEMRKYTTLESALGNATSPWVVSFYSRNYIFIALDATDSPTYSLGDGKAAELYSAT